MEIPALAVLFWILDHREVMLNAHPVREPPQGKAGADKIMEFPRAVKGRCIKINVIVDMGLVGMRTDEELIQTNGVMKFYPVNKYEYSEVYDWLRSSEPGSTGAVQTDTVIYVIRLDSITDFEQLKNCLLYTSDAADD